MPVTFFKPTSARRQGAQRFDRPIQIPTREPEIGSSLLKHRTRIALFQRRWRNIREDLPPQFSRRHSKWSELVPASGWLMLVFFKLG